MVTSGWTSRVLRRIQEMWPLIPASLYLLGFLIVVLVYLVGLTLSHSVRGAIVFPTFEPLWTVMRMPEFADALSNTAVFALIGTPLELVAGIFMALLVYRSFRAREVVRSLLLVPLAVPALVTATLLFILFDFPGGHVNALLMGKYSFFPQVVGAPINWRSVKVFALGVSLLGKVWRDMPISMLIILAGLNAIDPELLDAAKTMGASFAKRLRLVIIPLILPAISSVVLLRSLEMWKEFIFPFVLAGRYNLLGTLIESLYNKWGKSNEAAAVALILVACIVVSTFLFMWCMELVRKYVLKVQVSR
jgi:ABC-type sugar transport system permease subunit